MPFFSQLWEIGLSPQLNPHPPPPHTQPHCLYPSAVTSLPIHSGPRLQCFFNSYFLPMRGSLGGLGTHPLQLSFLSLETGHQRSFQNSVYSAMRLYQVSLSKHTLPWSPSPDQPPPPPPYCMSTTWLVVILFVFPNNPNNHQEEGWKWMEIIEAEWLKPASGLK